MKKQTPADVLQQRFGLTAFRPHQAAIVAAVLDGHDVLVLQPTGAGKSLCYQLPSLMFPPNRVTLVVCPLFSSWSLFRIRISRATYVGCQ